MEKILIHSFSNKIFIIIIIAYFILANRNKVYSVYSTVSIDNKNNLRSKNNKWFLYTVFRKKTYPYVFFHIMENV